MTSIHFIFCFAFVVGYKSGCKVFSYHTRLKQLYTHSHTWDVNTGRMPTSDHRHRMERRLESAIAFYCVFRFVVRTIESAKAPPAEQSFGNESTNECASAEPSMGQFNCVSALSKERRPRTSSLFHRRRTICGPFAGRKCHFEWDYFRLCVKLFQWNH